jgi:hypothetical protein
MTTTFKTNDDQYAALLNLLCAPSISIDPTPTTEGSSNTDGYELKLNVPNVEIKNSKKEFDCYLVSKARFNTKYVQITGTMAPCDYILAYKIKSHQITIGSAESKATKAFSLALSNSELEDFAVKFILNAAAILMHAYPDYLGSITGSDMIFEDSIGAVVDGINDKLGSIFGTSSLFGLYARGRFSGDNFSLPNKLLSQVTQNTEQDNKTDWDDMVLGEKHAYVTEQKMLKVLGGLSRSELTAKVKKHAKDNNLNYDSFMTGTRFQTGCADDVVCWMVER